MSTSLIPLLEEIRSCRLCSGSLLHDPRPVIQADSKAKLLIIGQAPGRKVHESGIPWHDASGRRLRIWLNMTTKKFYNPEQVAIVPMGFCYPGKGKNGDLPPKKECAATWHSSTLKHLPNIQIVLLVGQYAQQYYLGNTDFGKQYKTLTKRCLNANKCPMPYVPLPHPSPRNQLWLKKNPWFEEQNIPSLQETLQHYM